VRKACVIAFAGLALLVAGAANGTKQSLRLVAGGYWMYPAPPALARQCKAAQRHVRFTPLCPSYLPRSGDGATAATASQLPPGDGGVVPKTFAQWADYPKPGISTWAYVGGTYGGGETDPQDWSGNNPNYFFHFFVQQGSLSPKALNLAGVRHPQHFLGNRKMGGHVASFTTRSPTPFARTAASPVTSRSCGSRPGRHTPRAFIAGRRGPPAACSRF
jgi:hypothetical protein